MQVRPLRDIEYAVHWNIKERKVSKLKVFSKEFFTSCCCMLPTYKDRSSL